jgi:uncharacterized protein YqhQ
LHNLNIGGQAVIEGVMMRSPERVSTAVRKADGDIVIKNQEFISLTKRYKILGFPLIRGVVSFVEMLVIGIKTLNYSAEVAVKEAERLEGKEKKDSFFSSDTFKNIYLGFTVVFALALGIGIFFFLPLWFSQLSGVKKQALAFNLVAGAFRVTLFILYVWGISRIGEFKRIFQYHGAEHKSIYTYESGKDLTLENVREYGTRHPRCGTSFILIVAVFAIFVYSISDTIYFLLAGVPPTLPKRFLVHFCLLPLVAGVGYELLKLSGKARHNKIVKFLIAPGLWIQRITTQEPSDDQLEVAIVALQNALGKKTPEPVLSAMGGPFGQPESSAGS